MKNIVFLSSICLFFLTASCLKEDDGPVAVAPVQGGILEPEVGGATQPNQVWVDLSNPKNSKTSLRTDWDLGFYSGDEFLVIVNNSILMATASVESTDIDAVSQTDFSTLLNELSPAAGWSADFIDDVAGNYLEENGTVIDPINSNESDNKVYLLKLGYDTYQGNNVPPFSVYSIGDARGYKKIRILRNDENSYKIQYADLNDTTHQEFIVEKSASHHFSFFSFNTEALADIQPAKKNWDICFTIFNNEIEGFGTYTYADFIISNTLDGVGAYQVTTDPLTANNDYNNFTIDQVDESQFVYNDQRAIGSNWRSTVSGTTSTPIVYADRFFILKDPDGIIFKMRFLSMLDSDNMRGYPKFEFEPL